MLIYANRFMLYHQVTVTGLVGSCCEGSSLSARTLVPRERLPSCGSALSSHRPELLDTQIYSPTPLLAWSGELRARLGAN